MTSTTTGTECGALVPLVNGRQPYHSFLYCELIKLGHHDPEVYLRSYGFERVLIKEIPA